MNQGNTTGVEATIRDTPVLGELRVRESVLGVIDSSGTIEGVIDPSNDSYSVTRDALSSRGALTQLCEGQYLLPGLVDLHNHAPQWPQLGKALDVPLEDWLGRYTFPLEARYEDVGFASSVYGSLVTSMIANGTTTATYFATTHLPATELLVDTCLKHGQRAVIGKVAMDNPDGFPEYYRDSSAGVAIEDTIKLVEYINGHPDNVGNIVLPAVTPRFIPSCTDELLRGLGEIAEAESCHVQTHCSESDWAHNYGLERFGKSDTMTYQDFGLLTPRTVLAHSNFITPSDMDTIVSAGASVAHCPLSNFFFANAVLPVRGALERGMHIGLGTDISGGPSPSILNTAGNAVIASRVLEDGVDATVPAESRGSDNSRLTFTEAFWMATTGGGISLGLPIGVIEEGYSFDAVVIDTDDESTDLVFLTELDSYQDLLQKIIHNTVRQNITKVWVQGRQVRQ